MRLLEADPDLAGDLVGPERHMASQAAIARGVRVARGPWEFYPVPDPGDLGALVLDGLIIVRLGTRGDGVRERHGKRARAGSDRPADRSLAQRIAVWPQLHGALLNRLILRSRRLSLQAAINGQPRIEARLESTLRQLADRFGRVTRDGLALSLPITHTHLAEMVAAQRPSVSTALARLHDARRVISFGRGRWSCRLSPTVDGRLRSCRLNLPLKPPIQPQLARSRAELPVGEGWVYEPKYDGFRAIAFVDGVECVLQSRGGKPLSRYFPELSFPSGRYVLDGEIVIDASAEEQDFDALSNRIHPAASRIAMLADQTPARFVAFDLLAGGDEALLELSLAQRRAALEELLPEPVGSVSLTPLVRSADQAQPWLLRGEGVVAKELSAPYRPGQRTGMFKIKRLRTIDALVVGYRPGKEPGTVGSLILGLYDEHASLHVVGHSSGFKAAEKRTLVGQLAPYETGQRGHGDPSRWKSEKELEWIELRPELVVEVSFDHASGGRIRHGTKILRWREDKAPGECRLEQMAR
ncbi:MAG: ATP-dependent DNA ligase [Solirubrobacteraceae bacterium]